MSQKIVIIALSIFIGAIAADAQESIPKIYGQLQPKEGSPGYVPLFSSKDLDGSVEGVRHLVVLIHGAGYQGDSMFQEVSRHLKSLDGVESKNLLIVAPQFYSTEGKRGAPYAPNIIVWRNDWWRYGSRASQYMDSAGSFHNAGTATFDVLDSLVKDLQVVATDLETVTFFGFSAGGQLIQRYALYGSLNDTPENRVSFHYIVSSPASYMYLSNERPRPPFEPAGAIEFVVPAAEPDFDYFGYGMANLDGRNPSGGTICSYFTSTGLTKEEARARYETRDVHYFVGSEDTTQSGWDASDAAMTQGDSRVFRAQAFHRHLSDHFGKDVHKLNVVDGVEHSLTGVIRSDAFNDLLRSITSKPSGG